MKAVLFVIGLLLASPLAHAEDSNEDYRSYDKGQDIGTALYLDFMKVNGARIRASAVLKSCGKDGLAHAVEAKIIDRQFQKALEQAILEKKFTGYQSATMLYAQSFANALVVGYSFGYRDGASLGGDKRKEAACSAAMDLANELLK